jgi:hypothetical protein
VPANQSPPVELEFFLSLLFPLSLPPRTSWSSSLFLLQPSTGLVFLFNYLSHDHSTCNCIVVAPPVSVQHFKWNRRKPLPCGEENWRRLFWCRIRGYVSLPLLLVYHICRTLAGWCTVVSLLSALWPTCSSRRQEYQASIVESSLLAYPKDSPSLLPILLSPVSCP